VVKQPSALILPPGKVFGYRPVDHTLIGSPHEAPADAFWRHIYDGCFAPADRLFPMLTTVDGRVLRPYFNAGLMVVRPERGVFGAWLDNYARLQKKAFFAPYLTERIYRIFFHQAVLAGTVLNHIDPTEMALLPPTVSYPLHMHDQQPIASRAKSLEQLTTFRHEGIFHMPDWSQRLDISAGDDLLEWITERFPQMRKDPPAPAPASPRTGKQL
jgi:hypothetical protein